MKWLVIGIAVCAVLGAIYVYVPSLAHVAFYTPSHAGTTVLPVFGVSWMMLLGVGLAVMFNKFVRR